MNFLHHRFEKSTLLQSGDIYRHLDDEELLDLVQCRTLQYFIDYAHADSGMIRERSNHSSAYDAYHTVTTGGTGFGIMAMIVGVERGWLSSHDGLSRIESIVSFLENGQSYHGVFPHFMDGRTGKTIPFSKMDDGADLVETSFLMMGLLCAREYFGKDHPGFAARVNALWGAVEWNHHIHPEKKTLMWHWSQQHHYGMNHMLQGWNECFVTYVLGMASERHAIESDAYHTVWAKGKEFRNGREYYMRELPLGPKKGGPMFLSHYSFMGIDPNGLHDGYTNYGAQTRAHAEINYRHCVKNPYKFAGYGKNCWGLTASDSLPYDGRSTYRAHSPTEDWGVISPTAALSSMPYTPIESMRALRHFYEDRGDQLFRAHGFVDAFCPADGWTSDSHIAIDQGPIVVMIENYRSGLLWKLGMGAPEVRRGLEILGFKSPYLKPAPNLLVREPELYAAYI